MSIRTLGPLVKIQACLLVCGAFLVHSVPVAAQSSHYWGNQFGSESVLLNGTVIGSVTDMGAVYYNPARILRRASPAFAVSAKIYDWTSVRVEDGLGPGEDLARTTFGSAPGFLGGTFTLPFLEGHQFAYAMLSRNRDQVEYFVREQRSGDLYDFLPGEEDHFVGVVDLSTDFKEDWIGVAWAYPLSESWSVGATGFYFNRSAGRTVDLDLRGIAETLDAAALRVERSYNVSDQGLVAKLGVAWEGETVSWGLTATTPYWRVMGNGTVVYEYFQTGIPGDEGTGSTNALESTAQDDLPVDWKTPWSVGTGVGWTAGDWLFQGSVEYFSSVAAHDVLQADPVLGQSTGEPIDFTVTEERKSVFNGGVGVRWSPSETLSGFASVATNFSASPDTVVRFTRLEPTVSHTSLRMDFLLLGGGVSFKTRWADLTVGATWQGSSESARRLLDLPEEGEEPEEGDAELVIRQMRLMFGFSFPFSVPGTGEGEGG